MNGFVPVGPKRTFEGAVTQIAERIRFGELNEGDRLPAERDLAALFSGWSEYRYRDSNPGFRRERAAS